jgi:hypothetical protein
MPVTFRQMISLSSIDQRSNEGATDPGRERERDRPTRPRMGPRGEVPRVKSDVFRPARAWPGRAVPEQFRSGAHHYGDVYYWPGPLLAFSASAILFAISAFIASRLKLAPRCIGG